MNSAELEALAASLHGGDGRYSSGDRIGPYRVIRKISSGGMGDIYQARRDDNLFRHEVAIKLIRPPGTLPESALQRFQQERQILAQLDHPNIARLLDGGVTPGGRPYFAMEYIRGRRIDEHCRAGELNIAQRLELFEAVCAAVQYAHRNLIVHRDLKPANILVNEQGVVKLLDFGIAKLLRPEFYDGNVAATRAAERVATPEYASPEQLRGEPVSTASDVYSLGILLFLLLTGKLPFEFQQGSWEEIERLVCEGDPPAPSKRKPGIARDLDQIVLKAMRRHPEDRYASADHLAEDIRRYRQGYPVTASRGTWVYHARKFAQRNRLPLAFALVLGLVLAGWGVSWAQSAKRWRAERDTARQTVEYLVGMFRETMPGTPESQQLTARDLLDHGAARLAQLDQQPEAQAALADAIGESYRSLSLYGKARPLLERSLELNRRVHGNESAETAFALMRLSDAERDLNQFEQAEKHARESVAIAERVHGQDALETVESLQMLAVIREIRGDLKEAAPLFERAVRIRRRAPQPDRQLAMALSNLANVRREQKRFDEAERILWECLDLRKRIYGERHARVSTVLGQIGQIRQGQKRFAEAEAPFQAALELDRRIFTRPHVQLGRTLNNYGNLLIDLNRPEEAAALLEESLGIERKLRGPDAVPVSFVLNNLASAYERKGDLARAEPLYRESLAIRKKHFPADHPAVKRAEQNLAQNLAKASKAKLAATTRDPSR